MARPLPPPGPDGAWRAEDRPQGDPWHAFGYLVSGVLTYGAIGFGLDWWLGTSFLVAIGILLGAVLGLYMTVKRFDMSVTSTPTMRQETR